MHHFRNTYPTNTNTVSGYLIPDDEDNNTLPLAEIYIAALQLTAPTNLSTVSIPYSYRYGFNGKEREPSINDGVYDFGARMYDARIGRFFSTEPKYISYLGLSPYTFAGNSCIVLIDKNGEFPWVTGIIGAGVSVAVGCISANMKGEDYELSDGLKDAAVGFLIGSGAALLAPAVGVTATSSISTKILFQGSVGMGSGIVTNIVDQTYQIKKDRKESFETSEVIFSGFIGVFAGSASAGMGKVADNFIASINNKFFKELSKHELNKYIEFQSKYLKKELEYILGRKVGKRELEREIAKKVETWKELQEWQITGFKAIIKKTSETSNDFVISLQSDIIKNHVTEDE